MAVYLKYQSPWLQLLIFGGIVLGCVFLLGSMGTLAVAKIYDVPFFAMFQTNFDDPQVLKAAIALQAVVSIITFLVPVLIFAYLSDGRPMRYIGLKAPEPRVFLVIAIIMIFGVLPLVGWLSDINQNMHLPAGLKDTEVKLRAIEKEGDKLMEQFLTMKSSFDLLKMLFVVAVIPAFAEEFFFRGVIQRLMIQISKRPWLGILIASIIFSAMHGLYLGFLPRVLLGIMLGALCWYSGSLWPGIVAHFLNNASQVIMVYYYPKYMNIDPTFPVWSVAISSIFTVAVLWYLRNRSHTHYGEVFDTDEDFELHRRKDQIQ